MPTVDLTGEPAGIRPDQFAVDHFSFSGAGLRILSLSGGPNGLAFSNPALEIELPESAAHVRIKIYVDEAITIEALDSGGSIVPPPGSFAAKSGISVATFSTRPPAIVKLRVTGGDDESLVLSVSAE